MYCPNCGKSNSTEQKYCRSCGLSLEKTVASLAEQLPEQSQDQNLKQRQRTVDRWLNIVGVGAVSIVVVSVIYGVIFKLMIEKGAVIEGTIFLTFIVGLITFALLAIYRDKLDKASTDRATEGLPLVKDADTSKLLSESQVEPVTSVTDRTTELLTADKVRDHNKR